jgi:Rieske Fe-S protein
MDSDKVTRREFLANVGKTAIAAAVVSPVLGFEAEAKKAPMAPITLDVTKAEYAALAQAGGAIKIPNPQDKKKPIIVSRLSETSVAAYSSKCTHFGCEVPLPANNEIKCQCHGSMFDAAGKVTHGPASKDLAQFAATIEGSIITVKEMAS